MSTFSPIDLSRLPAPDVVETLDYEQILAARKARLVSLYPEGQQADVAAELALESDPRTKLLQENAYRELILRQRVNDAARAVLLAYATQADLDNIGAPFGVERLLLDAGDASAIPPVPARYEDDDALRRRIQLAPESYTSCGTFEAYRFHALTVAGVADAAVLRPEPGIVRVVLLASSAEGVPTAELLQAARDHLSARDRRSVSDTVELVPASIQRYAIRARLIMYPGPSAAPVLAAATAAAQSYAASVYRLGYDATLSGIYAALHQPGVQRVELLAPLADIVCDDAQAPLLDELSIEAGSVTDV